MQHGPLLRRNVEGVKLCTLPETGGFTLNVTEDAMQDRDFRSLSLDFLDVFYLHSSWFFRKLRIESSQLF